MSLRLALLFFASIAVATAIPQRPLRTHASQMRLTKQRQPSLADHSNVTRWFKSQLLDHFDAQSSTVWSQRYFVNETFFDGNGPVFLCVGGEGPSFDPDVVITGSFHCADMILLAQKQGALVLAIEHRYYGPPGSLPVPDFSTPNMRWLSSRQALADISLFHSHITQEFKLSPRNKWVSWGGSYPGMMAAFSRLKYPTLIHASVSSSAPVQAQYNFQGYNDVVAASMANPDVGGSSSCHDTIDSAFTTLGQMFSKRDQRPAIEEMFNVCTEGSLFDDANCASLSNTLSEIFPAQSNDPLCTDPACNIDLICQDMTNASLGSALQRLAHVTAKVFDGACVDANATADIQGLLNTTIEGGQDRTIKLARNLLFIRHAMPDLSAYSQLIRIITTSTATLPSACLPFPSMPPSLRLPCWNPTLITVAGTLRALASFLSTVSSTHGVLFLFRRHSPHFRLC